MQEAIASRAEFETAEIIAQIEPTFGKPENLSAETRRSILIDMTITACWEAFGPTETGVNT